MASKRGQDLALGPHLSISVYYSKQTHHHLLPGRVLPYLGMVGRVRADDPHFWDFLSDWVPILCLIMIWLSPSFCRQNWLSLSHWVPEILGPTFFIIMYYLTVFKHFVSIFSMIFDPTDPFFPLVLDHFDPSFLQNLRSDCFHFFTACWTRLPKIW